MKSRFFACGKPGTSMRFPHPCFPQPAQCKTSVLIVLFAHRTEHLHGFSTRFSTRQFSTKKQKRRTETEKNTEKQRKRTKKKRRDTRKEKENKKRKRNPHPLPRSCPGRARERFPNRPRKEHAFCFQNVHRQNIFSA